jgi:hypothetical protein
MQYSLRATAADSQPKPALTLSLKHTLHQVSDALESELFTSGFRDHLALAFIRDTRNGNTILKLNHYQLSLERALYRAIRELERLRTPQN